MSDNYFKELYDIDLSEFTQTKKGFSYVKWAVVWRELKLRYPDAFYKVYESADGCMYHTDGITAWVKVGVTIHGIENIEYMPITNRNNGLPLNLKWVNSGNASDAIQRAITKASARHGIALNLYIDDKNEPDSDNAENPEIEGNNNENAASEKDNHPLTEEEEAKLLTEMTFADIRKYKVQLRKERAAHPDAVFSDFAGIVKLFKNDKKKVDN